MKEKTPSRHHRCLKYKAQLPVKLLQFGKVWQPGMLQQEVTDDEHASADVVSVTQNCAEFFVEGAPGVYLGAQTENRMDCPVEPSEEFAKNKAENLSRSAHS